MNSLFDTLKNKILQISTAEQADTISPGLVATALDLIRRIASGLSDSHETNALGIDRLDAQINGGDYDSWSSIKSSGTLYEMWRIYGAGGADGGNILAGDPSASIIAFHVSAHQRIRLGGLKNSDNNPSVCWAIYNEYITPATDSTTSAALKAALISRDESATPGRSGVSANLTMPVGAAMLLISIPGSNDASTVERRDTSSESGLVEKVDTNTANIQSIGERIAGIPTMQTNITSLQTASSAQAQRLDLLQDCVAVKVKSLISTDRNTYGMVNNGRISNEGKILRGLDGNTTYIIALSAFKSKRFSVGGLACNSNNPSRCWAVFNIPESSVNWSSLTNPPYMLDWSNYLMSAYSDADTTEGRSNVSIGDLNLEGTGATFLVLSCLTSSAGSCAPVNYDPNQISDLKTKVETNITSLQTASSAQAQRLDLLQDCVLVNVKALMTTTPNDYGVINGFGRITNDGKIARDQSDVCTTYIIRLSAFTDKKFSATGLANNPNNASLCWATFNIPEANVDFNELFNSPYQLDWSLYLMAAYSDTSYATGRTGQTVELIDLSNTGATFLVFSTLTASADACSVRNYNSTLLTELQQKTEKAEQLVVIKNALGRPSAWNARTSITSDNITGTMTLGDDYATINIVSSSAVEGQHGLWFGFEGHNVVEGHKYMMILKYRNRGYSWGAAYYNSHISWSNDTYVRNSLVDDSDNNVWKYDVVNQYFTAPSSGDLWIDFMVYVNGTNTGAETLADFDMIPMMIDITDADLTADQLIAIMEKAGVIYDTLVLAPYAINPLKSITDENMICLGDSTTGMLMWQPKLARIKGWNFDGRSNGGLEFDGVDSPYTAMGIGGTAVEPIIYGTGAAGAGYSQYIRARYAHLYNPTVIFVMSSYNGAHNGAHWGNNASYPTQPDDYGLADLIASGMNTSTGTYNGTYMGEEVDLTADASAEVPSFAASYFGMIYKLVVDNPTARIILITLMNDFEPVDSAYLDLKNAVIKKAGEVFHLQVIDANCCGINRTNRLTTRYDEGGVHFNEAGGLMLAKYIASQV